MRVLHVLLTGQLLLLLISSASGQLNRDLTVEEMQGESRIALLIGNGAYDNAPLKNPPNDVRAMSRALTSCGFEVIEKIDCSKKEMYSAIQDFGKKIQRGSIGLFYYAGHGMQVKGRNYLIPVRAGITAEDEVEFQAIDASLVLSKMETAENRVNIVILDACRNNPFARSFRSGGRGLARMDAAKGTFISYATAPGRVASDGDGANSLYTSALIRHILQPGVKIEEVFKQVRGEVAISSAEAQIPWESSSLIGDFYFRLPDITAGASPFASAAPAPEIKILNVARLSGAKNPVLAAGLNYFLLFPFGHWYAGDLRRGLKRIFGGFTSH